MSPFIRQLAPSWGGLIPGVRWYRSDLHLHTLDDHLGGRTKVPSEVGISPIDARFDPKIYARVFLQKSIKKGIHVLGLTPHNPFATPQLSLVWEIVEEWNSGIDDDEIPFREKIFAVFPGFEPNLSDGAAGVHFLFLFDPEIGRERYTRAYNASMGGIAPYHEGNSLKMSPKKFDETYDGLQNLKQAEGGWDFIVLAPHAFSNHGFFQEQKSQVLQQSAKHCLHGIELGDDKSLETTLSTRQWLLPAAQKLRHGFFHGSDAYSVEDIGNRWSLIKLAEPTVAALKQAFLANDSRIRLAFGDREDGSYGLLPSLPDPGVPTHPWMRWVEIKSSTSFFSKTGGETFHFSPYFNCIIGGSMTGKSTFLDGLRSNCQLPMPSDRRLSSEVLERGQHRFAGMEGSISVSVPPDTYESASRPTKENWPAWFFTQGELKTLAGDDFGRAEVIHGLDPDQKPKLDTLLSEIRGKNHQLKELSEKRTGIFSRLTEEESAFNISNNAKLALVRFEDLGIADLHNIQRDTSRLRNLQSFIVGMESNIYGLSESVRNLVMPEISEPTLVKLLTDDNGSLIEDFNKFGASVHDIQETKKLIHDRIQRAVDVGETHERELKHQLAVMLVQQGGRPEDLDQFDALSRSARDYENLKSSYERTKKELEELDNILTQTENSRLELREKYRESLTEVGKTVQSRYRDIRIRFIPQGNQDELGEFLTSFAQVGITRWWNERRTKPIENMHDLLCKFARNSSNYSGLELGDTTKSTLWEKLQGEFLWRLRSIWCPDLVLIEKELENGEWRGLEKLSGGERTSVLLTLLLDSDDNRPLVIDQPEDDLNNRFLWDKVLPALRMRKDRRQIIFATHNANIVVNGDADQVLYFEANAEQGWVSSKGAIEQPKIRNAILEILDGGQEAFHLRKLKYGF
ncbi:TrlF family AAA-like ATPase [Geothrix edaphica]|uniref:Uncharacterized protein n=1 Tax=Geothrix edaphica TaxID=2927976 RepID=A0ABQ5PU95_9BACT|nr:hypothetical protein [Geothrix edaphica]GLH65934.1 hypothetical protein GETHED_02980 [Geothrix edaphica]